MTLSAIDRLDILDVITRADDAATRRDADAYVSFFTEDAVLDGIKGNFTGIEALRQSVSVQFGLRRAQAAFMPL